MNSVLDSAQPEAPLSKKRVVGRPFVKGQSGNPGGARLASLPKLRAQITKVAPKLVQKLIDLALEGDVQAAKTLLNKITPDVKPQALPVNIELPPDAGLAGSAWAFMNAAATGQLPPDQAADLISALGSVAKILEASDFEKRLQALESTVENK